MVDDGYAALQTVTAAGEVLKPDHYRQGYHTICRCTLAIEST